MKDSNEILTEFCNHLKQLDGKDQNSTIYQIIAFVQKLRAENKKDVEQELEKISSLQDDLKQKLSSGTFNNN